MSVKSCEKLEKSQVELTVEVSAADFEAAIEKAYRKQRGQIRIQGFRPGKAPRKMIERMYGEAVFYEEAVNTALPDAYAGAVKEQELDVVGYPQVELLKVGKEGFSFKATVAVYPEVTLGQYKGVEAPKAPVILSTAGAVKPLEGKPFDGGAGTEFDLAIGSGQFVPGFEDQIVGMSVGEEKDIDITFPENYHADLAGKAVVFHVKVNAVKVKELPEMDDEFAKDVSEFDTLEELRADVRVKLTEEREEAGRRAFEDTVMGKVADAITCDIPDAMIDAQAQYLVENLARQIQSQGLSFEQYMQMTNTDPEKLKADAMEPAQKQVRMDLAVAAIIKEENIEVTEEDIDAEYQKRAEEFKMDVETLKKYLERNMIREQLLRNKAVAVVVDSAVATEPVEAPVEEAAPAEEKPKKRRTSKKKAEEAPAEEAPAGE